MPELDGGRKHIPNIDFPNALKLGRADRRIVAGALRACGCADGRFRRMLCNASRRALGVCFINGLCLMAEVRYVWSV